MRLILLAFLTLLDTCLLFSVCHSHYSINSTFTSPAHHWISILGEARDPHGWSFGLPLDARTQPATSKIAPEKSSVPMKALLKDTILTCTQAKPHLTPIITK